MPTTPDDIYRRLRQAIVDELDSLSVSSSKVSVVTEWADDLNSDFFVQIRPVGGPMASPRVGLQVVDDVAEVRTVVREMKDFGSSSTLQLSGETKSTFARVEPVRRALRNNWLDYALLVPVRHVRHGIVERDPGSGFSSVVDSFSMTYELSSAGAWLTWGATAPTTLASAVAVPLDGRTSVTREATTSSYIWALVPSDTEVVFWHEAGRVEFYSPDSPPPSGPTCSEVTIAGTDYWQWRSPYASHGTSADYRVSRA